MMLAGVERRSWPALAAAGSAWAAAAGARWWGWPALVALALAGLGARVAGGRQRFVLLVLLVAAAGWWSGYGSAAREAAILAFETTPGPVTLQLRLLDDPRPGDGGWWALAVADPPEPGRPPSIPMLVSFPEPPPVQAGEVGQVQGLRSERAGRARGDPYSGVVRVTRVEVGPEAPPPWWKAGNLVRGRALERLHGRGSDRALLAGFLVGDTTEVPAADLEAMRRSGLTHLVAVSGSNVALFLTLTLVAVGPLASGPRRRAVVGILALVVLVIATRWEPSVIRASAMAGLVLAGRVGGWALDTATALSVTVIGVVVTMGEMATDVGFALSVLATLGVLVGGRFSVEWLPRPVAMTLGATAGAQVAVAPILLAVFEVMPLMAPLTNLVAIPVVSASTVAGAIGVAGGWDPLISLASHGAAIVLAVARLGAGWPQVGWAGMLAALVVLGLLAIPVVRPAAALGGAVALCLVLLGSASDLAVPGAVVLDVGQGDSILIVSPGGRKMLVDGGPDPAVLEAKLASYGISTLDLVVLTHVHADHAAGLEAVFGRRAVGTAWLPGPPHSTPASRTAARLAATAGIPTSAAPVGQTLVWDGLEIEVLGPRRRYASPNDQSVVLRIGLPEGPSLLLTGDIETHAQTDLADLTADILKVPHQGAATSDLDWLTGVGAAHAVISVGPNDFGHPSPEVVATLEDSGVRVFRTDRDGDVVIPLSD